MKNLDQLRIELDAIDTDLLELLQRRMQIVDEVGQWKKQAGVPAKDANREEAKLQALYQKAGELGLPNELIFSIWQAIFIAAVKREEHQ